MLRFKVNVDYIKADEILNNAVVKRAFEDGLDDIADFIQTEAKRNVEEKAFDRGTLHGGIVVNRGLWRERFIVSRAPYSAAIEYGTVPHKPPVGPLIGWVRRNVGLRGKAAVKMAEAISWKIYHHGSPPKPFMRPAFDLAKVEANKMMAKRVKGVKLNVRYSR